MTYHGKWYVIKYYKSQLDQHDFIFTLKYILFFKSICESVSYVCLFKQIFIFFCVQYTFLLWKDFDEQI